MSFGKVPIWEIALGKVSFGKVPLGKILTPKDTYTKTTDSLFSSPIKHTYILLINMLRCHRDSLHVVSLYYRGRGGTALFSNGNAQNGAKKCAN